MSNQFTTKQRRTGEMLAEWSIRIVASFSIIVIFLIFLFVFRESFSVFNSESDQETLSNSMTEQVEEPLTPEKYQLDDDLSRPAPQFRGEAPSQAEQHRYIVLDPDGPEIYNPEPAEVARLQRSQAPASPDQYIVLDPDGPEIYNPEPGEIAQFRAAQSMDEKIYVPKNPNYPEIYNPEVGGLPADIDDAPEAGTENVAEVEQPSLWDNLWGPAWQPIGEQPKFSIVPLLIGTAKTTFLAILFGAPLGIFAALYTAFFAPRRVRNVLKPAIELLAGFPSVVIGFFCLVTVASFIQSTIDSEFRLNALVGGIGLSLAVLPIVYSITEDALSSVPKTLREASLALGSTEWQTAYRVMLPAAAPGVFAAVILGVGRAFGETMIAIMATGNGPMMSWSAFTPARTFAATIGSEMGEVVWGSEHYGVLFLLGTILFVVSFGLNAITELYVKKRFIKRFQGK